MVFRIALFTGIVCIFSAPLIVTAQETDISSQYQIIANSTGLTEMTLMELKQSFRGKYYSWDSKIDVIIVLPSSKHKNAENISKDIYGKSFYGVKKFWLSLVFQGRFNAPQFFDSDKEIAEFVAKNQGAIGLVSKKTNVVKQLVINLKK